MNHTYSHGIGRSIKNVTPVSAMVDTVSERFLFNWDLVNSEIKVDVTCL